MKELLLRAFHATAASTGDAWVAPYTPPEEDRRNQFVLFLKPEVTCTARGANLPGVLDLVFAALDRFEVRVGAARILSGTLLRERRIMDLHYGVINRISTQGAGALTEAAAASLRRLPGDPVAAGARVLGAHQFLEEQPDITPLALGALNDNVGTTKLGGGAYAMRLRVLGRPYIVLNPFHPYQLMPYTAEGSAILVLEGSSARPWGELRQNLIGATDPDQAAPGSLRAEFLRQKKELGLPAVDMGRNGIHLSAGPLEGMVEITRFCTAADAASPLPFARTAFGALLARSGVSGEEITRLAGNPVLERGVRRVTAFDLTEEADAGAAVRLLLNS